MYRNLYYQYYHHMFCNIYILLCTFPIFYNAHLISPNDIIFRVVILSFGQHDGKKEKVTIGIYAYGHRYDSVSLFYFCASKSSPMRKTSPAPTVRIRSPGWATARRFLTISLLLGK